MLNRKRLLTLGAAALMSSAPAWADVCVAPGDIVLTDPSGDAMLEGLVPLPSPLGDFFDLQSISIATPSAESMADQTIVFTIQTGGTAPAFTPDSGVFSSFLDARGLTRGVRAQGDQSGGITYFSYVASPAGAMQEGPTDGRFVEDGSQLPAEGSYADGVVTITVKAKDVGVRDTGDVLSGFNAGTVLAASVPGVGGGALLPDSMPDDLSRGAATPIVFSPCAKSLNKQGSGLIAGSMPLAGLLLLGLLALARRRV